MARRKTAMTVVELLFCLLGAAVGATLAAIAGYTLFGIAWAVPLGIAGLIFGYVGTRAGADWFTIFH
jgi:hypothetical protein